MQERWIEKNGLGIVLGVLIGVFVIVVMSFGGGCAHSPRVIERYMPAESCPEVECEVGTDFSAPLVSDDMPAMLLGCTKRNDDVVAGSIRVIGYVCAVDFGPEGINACAITVCGNVNIVEDRLTICHAHCVLKRPSVEL